MKLNRNQVLRASIVLTLVALGGCSDDDGFLGVPGDPPFGTPALTATPTLAAVATATPVATSTAVPAATSTATQTPVPALGPVVSFFGVARADDNLVEPEGVTADGVPIYSRPFGAGFRLVVEGRSGPNDAVPGDSAFDTTNSAAPDLQILSSRPLGNGSSAVCDRIGAAAGGVPAVDPPHFGPSSVAAINDFGCRFLNGLGEPSGRTSALDGCIQVPSDSGTYGFAGLLTRVQFCALVDTTLTFPSGDTRLTVRLLDRSQNPGEPAQIIVRVP